jgi:hypothetical protein
MAVSTKVQPIDKDVEAIISELLSPAAQSAVLADIARATLKDADQQNQMVLGRKISHETYVDGVRGASEDRVRPSGRIVYEFDLTVEVFVWIANSLKDHAPVLTGEFKSSFKLFADGSEIAVGDKLPLDASEFVFLSELPYARKLERGLSPQAPDGVFEAVATLAQARFGNLARIQFGYRAPFSGQLLTGKPGDRADNRTPAIIVTLRG